MPGLMPNPSDCCSAPCGDSICLPTPISSLASGLVRVDSIVALRALDGSITNGFARVVSTTPGLIHEWYYDLSSTSPDDGTELTNAVLPHNIDSADAGRWLPW